MNDDVRWTIDELGQQVSRALSRDYDGPPNDRITAVPQKRTIRYYTTLGILDRPIEMQGRTALYGPRHLLQLVAVKRLQAAGVSLADIQNRLSNLSDKEIAAIARLSAPSKSPRRVSVRAEDSFWQSAPAEPAEPNAVNDEEIDGELESIPPSVVTKLRVTPGVELFFDTARTADRRDAVALREAAEPLLAALKSRGLIPHNR